jgi:ribosomal protein S27E
MQCFVTYYTSLPSEASIHKTFRRNHLLRTKEVVDTKCQHCKNETIKFGLSESNQRYCL